MNTDRGDLNVVELELFSQSLRNQNLRAGSLNEMRTPPRDIPPYDRETDPLSEEALVVAVLGYLGSDPERLAALLNATGLDPQSLRTALTTASFRGGLFDYIMSDDSLLISFAADQNRPPEAIAAALMRSRRRPSYEGE